MSAPEWAALAALLNQAQGKNVGAFNPVIYPLVNTDAFHNAASMSSDFAHVGLGSPNLNVMNRLLKGSTLGRRGCNAFTDYTARSAWGRGGHSRQCQWCEFSHAVGSRGRRIAGWRLGHLI